MALPKRLVRQYEKVSAALTADTSTGICGDTVIPFGNSEQCDFNNNQHIARR